MHGLLLDADFENMKLLVKMLFMPCQLSLPIQHQFSFCKPPFIVQRTRKWKRLVQLSSPFNIQL